jgi:hypothetical protein
LTRLRRLAFAVMYAITLAAGSNAAGLARLVRRLVAVDVVWLPLTSLALAAVLAMWAPMRLLSLATFSACRALASEGASA